MGDAHVGVGFGYWGLSWCWVCTGVGAGVGWLSANLILHFFNFCKSKMANEMTADTLWRQFHHDVANIHDIDLLKTKVHTLEQKLSEEESTQRKQVLERRIIHYLENNHDAMVLYPENYRLYVDHPHIIDDEDENVHIELPYEFELGGYKWRDLVDTDLTVDTDALESGDWVSKDDGSNKPVVDGVPESYWILTAEDDPEIDWFRWAGEKIGDTANPDHNKANFDDPWDNGGKVFGNDKTKIAVGCFFWLDGCEQDEPKRHKTE